ncbi:hypothetical protein [Actinacidiphila yanglinensis]|uniref:hypothetical protein n=1 Tax=Actinacidiphila yanglinensis TaxID=310779 RepID=UPI000CDEA4FA|nr:hypothetical protein [Actinacidiphila yanglinensis]
MASTVGRATDSRTVRPGAGGEQARGCFVLRREQGRCRWWDDDAGGGCGRGSVVSEESGDAGAEEGARG